MNRIGEFRGLSPKFLEVRGRGGDSFQKSPNFGDGAGMKSAAKWGRGRGGESIMTTGNFEVCPRKSSYFGDGDEDNKFGEFPHPNKYEYNLCYNSVQIATRYTMKKFN